MVCAVCRGTFWPNERYASSPLEPGVDGRAHLTCADMARFLTTTLKRQEPVSFQSTRRVWGEYLKFGAVVKDVSPLEWTAGLNIAGQIDARLTHEGMLTSDRTPWVA